MSLLRTNTKKYMKQQGNFSTRVPKAEDFTEYVYEFADGAEIAVDRTELTREVDADMYQGLKREANNNRTQMEEHGAYAKNQEEQELLYNMQTSQNDIEIDVIKLIEIDELRRAVIKLQPLQRDAIVKKYWQGKSNTEIAAEEGVSEGAIRDRLTRAVKNLGKLL
jgi:RNA polymerase sigma factor (sigma-70 family)